MIRASFSWERVNKIFFVLTLSLGVVCTVLTWLPSMLYNSFFGDYTRSELLPIEDSLSLLMRVATITMVLLTIWNASLLVVRDQVPVSKGVLHHCINLILFLGEVVAMVIIVLMTPSSVITLWQVVAVQIAISAGYWLVCAFIIPPHRGR